MGVPYVTEAVARAISSDVAEQKITSANIPEIEANPTLEGGESALTALEVNGTKYTVSGGSGGSEVVANPELEGDEDSLTGLEVDGVKYKVDGGSSTSRPRELIFINDLFGDFKTDYAVTDPSEYELKFSKEAIDSIGELLLEKSQNENPPTGVHLVGEDMYLGVCIPLENPASTSDFISYTAVDEMGEGLEITTITIFGDVPTEEDGYYKVTATGLPYNLLDLACTCDLLYAELEASEPTLTLSSSIKDSEIMQLVSQLEIEVEPIPGE